jgi:hypothetical protein
VQSFQSGSKFRSLIFRVAILAFFAISAYAPAQTEQQLAATTTKLAVSTQDSGARTKATFDISVASSAAVPGGTVTLVDGKSQLGSAVLDANGHATLTVNALPAGTQQGVAVYNGETLHSASTSTTTPLASATTGVADYTLAATSTSLSVTSGQTAVTTLTVTPENGFNQTVSFSCTGLPSVSTCTFTPSTVSTTAGTAVSSTLYIQTTAVSGAHLNPLKDSGLYYALALPGVLALLGLGKMGKRFPVAGRTLSLALLLGISMFGMTACAARYNYFHHGPGVNTGTPAGTYTVTVTSSSDNGISETAHQIQLTLTVK